MYRSGAGRLHEFRWQSRGSTPEHADLTASAANPRPSAERLAGFTTEGLRTEDEFGFSDSSTGQTNFLTFTVLHPNVVQPSHAEMSHFELRTDDDTSRHQENLTTGQHYFGHLFSTGPVPAGESVTVVAGTRSFDITSANDVEVHSASNFQWFINSVEIRIAP